MFNQFTTELREINSLKIRDYVSLSLLFLFSSFFDLIGLSLIGPFVQNFFIEDVSKNNFLLANFEDTFLESENFFFLTSLVLILVFLSKGLFGYLVIRKIIIFASMQQAKLITDLSQKLIISKKNTQPNSQIISNFLYNIRIYIEQTLMSILRLIAEAIITLSIIIFLMINFFKLSVLIITFLFLSFLIYFYLIQKKIYRYGKIASNSSEKMIEDTNNILNGYRDIIIYSKEKFFHENIKFNTYNQMLSGAKANAFTQLPKYFFDAFFASSFIIFLYFGKNMFPKSEMLLYISVVGLATYRLLPSLFQISICISNLKFSRPHLFEISKISRELKFKDQIILNSNLNFDEINSIEIKNLNFSYSETKESQIFKNFNLKISNGDSIFISGRSGVGKSTLANIISGFVKPDSGDLFVNNVKINDIISFSKKYVSYSSQNIFLTRGSIVENITMFEKNVDENKLKTALEVSCCNEFLKKKNIDQNFLISDYGKNFSGGEKQRIQLARSLYFDKKIMIFDEATSAIEKNLEISFLKKLSNLVKDKIVIFISHREKNKEFFNKNLNL